MRYGTQLRKLLQATAALGLLAALSAVWAPLAPADKPVLKQTLLMGRFWYCDDNGWGSMVVQPLGSNPDTGATLVRVQLTQNGATYTGSGSQVGGHLTFALSDPALYFETEANHYGSYHPIGQPEARAAFWMEPMASPLP
jgi:hypothetical protein